MNKEIIEKIEQYKTDLSFFGGKSDEEIENVEKDLEVKFDSQYREYLKLYGAGGILGVSICGIENEKYKSVLEITNNYRNFNLSKGMYIISDMGEFALCMYSSEFEDTKVYSCSKHDKSGLIESYNSFDEFLIDYINEGIDNL